MGGIVYIAEPHPWIPAFAGMTELCKGLPRGKIEMGALGLTKSKAVHSTPSLNSSQAGIAVSRAAAP